SCGVAEFSPDNTVEELIRRADEALYEAKRTGKNRVVIAKKQKSLWKSLFREEPYQPRLLRVRDLRGLPPSLPFARDEAAFRLDFTAPRHAGQKHTRSMRWIGHFGIELAS